MPTILVCGWALDTQMDFFLIQCEKATIRCIYTSILTFQSEIRQKTEHFSVGAFILFFLAYSINSLVFNWTPTFSNINTSTNHVRWVFGGCFCVLLVGVGLVVRSNFTFLLHSTNWFRVEFWWYVDSQLPILIYHSIYYSTLIVNYQSWSIIAYIILPYRNLAPTQKIHENLSLLHDKF